MSSDVAAPSSSTPSALEALRQRHGKEQRELVSRTTQKKKQASKKTRKGVMEECERLEREMRERQAEEVRVVSGEAEGSEAEDAEEGGDGREEEDNGAVQVQIESLSINGRATSPPSPTPARTGKKPNRQKERLARRKAEHDAAIRQAEEEALHAPNPREQETQRFEPLLAARGLALHPIRADGHCLYAAVADQLATRALSLSPSVAATVTSSSRDDDDDVMAQAPPYKKVRHVAAGWMERHGDEFAPFLEDPLQEHVRRIRETGEWGGHLELVALAKSYGVRICVLHGDGRVDRIEDGAGEEQAVEEIWLGYYRHSHGLGEHYNSLRTVGA